jgi:threonine/homoserine/homoserine lactone efflux protein
MEFLTIAVMLGISAGFAPGPLLALVLSETLQHGIRSGLKVAIAPLITDLPIIILIYYLSSLLTDARLILGVISLAGSLFVFWMGYKSLSIRGVDEQFPREIPRSLTKGLMTNMLSPYPYLFWLTVGIPILNKTMLSGPGLTLSFIGMFYICIVSAKCLLALIVGKSRGFLNGTTYHLIMRILGLALCGFAFMLFWDGLAFIGLMEQS